MEYRHDDLLQLSGIQHFAFCRRQWALIHIEKLWAENYRTTDGALMHDKAHDPELNESRGDLCIMRGVSVSSARLGISGQCDVVEFMRGEDGISLSGREGLWKPYPVEYKRGESKTNDCDMLQLCAQAMCLEEMLCCNIPEGALYYGQPRRRQRVELTAEMRQKVRDMLLEMHDYYRRGYTPKVKPSKGCNACSMKELCLPKLIRSRPVREYLRKAMEVEP